MHSYLVISRADFPTLIPDDTVTGDRIRLVVTAIVRRIEDQLVDASGYGQTAPRYVTGDTEHELLIVEARTA